MTLFVDLVRVALGQQDALSSKPSEAEWRQMFILAKKQTLTGVCFSGLERLPAEQRPPRELLLKWWVLTQHIEEQNRVMNQRTQETVDYFRNHGFNAMILKGQGIGRLYPQPERRMPGDIDVWLDGGREKIYAFAREHDDEGKLHGMNYHHIHYHLFEDTEVEVHIHPSYMNNPFLQKRFHKFCYIYRPTGKESIPSPAFNRVFILLHCFQHLMGHGVGLRQVMDYYFVLTRF